MADPERRAAAAETLSARDAVYRFQQQSAELKAAQMRATTLYAALEDAISTLEYARSEVERGDTSLPATNMLSATLTSTIERAQEALSG